MVLSRLVAIMLAMNAPHISLPLCVETLCKTRPTLRVAVVTETYPPEVNGVAMTVSRLCEGLIRRQHTVQLIRPRQHGAELPANAATFEEILAPGMTIPTVDGARFGLPARSDLFALWSHRRPDIVHIATEGPLGWSALSVARKLKLPVSTSFHTNFDAYSRHYGIGWLRGSVDALLRKFHNRADMTFVPTGALLLELKSRGFQKLELLARGVDTVQFSPTYRSSALRARWGLVAEQLGVLYVGRLAPEKNLPLLFQAFAAIREAQPDARLIVVGDGPLRKELGKRYPEVIFAGARCSSDLAEHYASADLFLFPSQTETFGNVTLEAMASGPPVVAYRQAAAAEVISSGLDGLLAEAGDEREFIDCARALAGNAGMRRFISRAARERVMSIDWERIHDAFSQRLVALVKRHHRLRNSDFFLVPD